MSTTQEADVEVENDDTFDTPVVISSDTASTTQADVSREIQEVAAAYQRSGIEETQPRLDYPPYRSSVLRHPTKDPHHADPEAIELETVPAPVASGPLTLELSSLTPRVVTADL